MKTVRKLGKNALTIHARLHKIGEQKPYFSITAEERTPRGYIECYGCMHDKILRVAPELAPIVALHLSDDDGVPMHAAANGLYWLQNGAWWSGEFHRTEHSEEESLQFSADHFRAPLFIVTYLRKVVREMSDDKERHEWISKYVDGCKERWNEEARIAIETFGLQVETN